MKILILFISFLLVSMPMTAMGAAKVYRTPTIPPPNSGIQFFVPYTLGTHEGEARMITGSLSLDLADPSLSHGEFSVPINSMTTRKAQRDCHMMEALMSKHHLKTLAKKNMKDYLRISQILTSRKSQS